jgi:hypothetical protein
LWWLRRRGGPGPIGTVLGMTLTESGVAFLDLGTAHDRDGPCAFAAFFIHRAVDGRGAETWRCADDLRRLLQPGARVGAP